MILLMYLNQSIYNHIKGRNVSRKNVIGHSINISKYNPLAGSSCTKLPKEFVHPRKSLINVHNIDNNNIDNNNSDGV